jgi:hypothetical protein
VLLLQQATNFNLNITNKLLGTSKQTFKYSDRAFIKAGGVFFRYIYNLYFM